MKRPLAWLGRAGKFVVEAGLLLVLPLIFSRSFSEQFTYPKRVLGESLVIVAAMAWILSVIWAKAPVVRPSADGLVRPLILLASVVLISCVNSPAPSFSLRESVYFLCGPAWAVVLIGWTVEGQESEVQRLCVFGTLGGTAVALIALAQWAGHDPLLLGGYEIDWGSMVARMRLYATLGNPNFVAGYLIATAFLGTALAACTSRLVARAAWIAAVAVMLAAIVGTGSRGAWIGLGAGLVAAMAVWKGLWARPAATSSTATCKEKPPAAAGLWQAKLCATYYGLVCLGLFLAGWPEVLNAWVQHLQGRVFLWRAAWPMFTTHPVLGSGWATFQLRFLDLQARCLAAHPEMVRHWTNTRQLHNDLLQFLLETGGLGLLAWVWLLWVYVKRLRNSQGTTRPTRLWLPASAGAVTAILVNSLFNFQFAIPPTFVLVFTLLAVPEMLAKRASEPKAIETPPTQPRPVSHQVASRVVGAALAWFRTKRRSPQRVSGKRKSALLAVWRCVAGLGVVAGATFLLFEIGRQAVAERDYALGRQLESRGDMARAEKVYRHGIQANPLNGRLHFGLARVLYLSQEYAAALEEIPRAEQTFADSHLEVLRARIEDQMGLADRALAAYRRALALDPTLKTVQADIKRLSK